MEKKRDKISEVGESSMHAGAPLILSFCWSLRSRRVQVSFCCSPTTPLIAQHIGRMEDDELQAIRAARMAQLKSSGSGGPSSSGASGPGGKLSFIYTALKVVVLVRLLIQVFPSFS